MKSVFSTLGIWIFTLPAMALAELCPVGSESGSPGCFKVEQVFIIGEWAMACCGNIDPPDGFECAWDDCSAKKNSVVNFPLLTPQNARIRFSQGYRFWILERDKLYSYHRQIDLETMHSYLPIARKIFLKNERIESFSIAYSDSISIIIQRPDNAEMLQEEIIFPKRVSAAELSQMLKDLDDQSLQVYPNPAQAYMSIFFERNVRISKVEILSLKGATCYKRIYSEPRRELALELENLESATYILRITDSIDREFNRKIEKE